LAILERSWGKKLNEARDLFPAPKKEDSRTHAEALERREAGRGAIWQRTFPSGTFDVEAEKVGMPVEKESENCEHHNVGLRKRRLKC